MHLVFTIRQDFRFLVALFNWIIMSQRSPDDDFAEPTGDVGGTDGASSTEPPEMTAERAATAYHEAGHAVMAISLGRSIHKVTIVAGRTQYGGAKLGSCELQKGRSRSTKDVLEDEVLILLAGMVAEAHFTGHYCPQGAAQDLRGVERLLCTRAKSQKQHEKLHRRMLDKTEHLLQDSANSDAIRKVAAELIKKNTLSGRAVRHFFSEAERKHR